MFDCIPNKRSKSAEPADVDVWPELADQLEINLFYRRYASAEGWLGEGYVMIWPRDDIAAFCSANVGTYPDKYKFFGSNGGGTQFGFYEDRGVVVYVAAPDIGHKGDIKILGNWHNFTECVSRNEYI